MKRLHETRAAMPSPSLPGLSAAQRQRLSYIEFRLWFFGSVTRKEVLERFDLATAAGTRDLTLYRELAPLNAAYERKRYEWLPTFQPLFEHPVDRVLGALTTGFGAGEPSVPGEVLPHASPYRLNPPPVDTLATLARAIHRQEALTLTYYSMKTGASPREIVPHALVDSGLRWHVRAFDRTKGEFRDLVITRMEGVHPVAPSAANAQVQPHEQGDVDVQWQTFVQLDLRAHPAHPQASVIERDFGMQDGNLRVNLRAAIAGYVLRQWQVDCSPRGSLKGPEFRLRLADPGQLAGVANALLAPGYAEATE